MTRELHIDEALPPEYWEQLGLEGEQAKPGDPFSSPPPGKGTNPFTGVAGPTGRSRWEAGWLRTYGGVEFLDVFIGDNPGGDSHQLIFLYEAAPGSWGVGYSRPKTTRGGGFHHKDVTYEEAKRLAEEEAMAISVDAGAAADWRFSPPSPGQLSFIRRLDIDVDEEITTKGQASDLINVATASRTLDPAFAKEKP